MEGKKNIKDASLKEIKGYLTDEISLDEENLRQILIRVIEEVEKNRRKVISVGWEGHEG